MITFDELTPATFTERRLSGETWQLLDVREPWELERAAVADALHIPMAEIPERLGELNQEEPIAVLCHSGVRSARVAGYLVAQGYAKVANISGGIDAWSIQVDPRVPQY